MKEKHVICEDIEEKFIRATLQRIEEEGLTATNVKEAMEKVYMYMEDNAILKKTT